MATTRTLAFLFTSVFLLCTIIWFSSSEIHIHGLEKGVLAWLQYKINKPSSVESFTNIDSHYSANKDLYRVGSKPKYDEMQILPQVLQKSEENTGVAKAEAEGVVADMPMPKIVDKDFASSKVMPDRIIVRNDNVIIVRDKKEYRIAERAGSSSSAKSLDPEITAAMEKQTQALQQIYMQRQKQQQQQTLLLQKQINFARAAARSASSPDIFIQKSDQDSANMEKEESEEDETPLNIPFKETDFLILSKNNFSKFVTENKYVAVHFYMPWSYSSRVQALEDAAAESMLEGKVVFAKVDASVEKELAKKHRFVGYSTLYFFIDGILSHTFRRYNKRDVIVSLLQEKMKGSVYGVTKPSKDRDILKTDYIIIVALLDNQEGPDAMEFAAAVSKSKDNGCYNKPANMYIPKKILYQNDSRYFVFDKQTDRRLIATIFGIDPEVKRPALFMKRKDAGNFIQFDGPFVSLAISEFVSNNQFPLVTTYNERNAIAIVINPMKKLWLIASDEEIIEKVMPTFKEAAEFFNGKLLFVSLQMDLKERGKLPSLFRGTENDQAVIAYSEALGPMKCIMRGEISLTNVKSFGEDILGKEQCSKPVGSSSVTNSQFFRSF